MNQPLPGRGSDEPRGRAVTAPAHTVHRLSRQPVRSLRRSARRSVATVGFRRVRLQTARPRTPLGRAARTAARMRHGVLFYPVVMSLVAVAIAQTMVAIDARVPVEAIPASAALAPSVAASLLTALAGTLVTVVAVLFWVRAAQVSLAATQFSARMLTGYLGDRRLQLTMGFVVGTFTYVVAVLMHVPAGLSRPSNAHPDLAVLGAILLVLVAVLRIVAAVMNGARMTHASEIVDRIARATIARIRAEGAPGMARDGAGAVETVRAQPAWDPAAAEVVLARDSGWVRHVDEEALLAALPAGGAVSLRVRVGEFVTEGQAVARVWPQPEAVTTTEPVAADHTAINAALTLGSSRTVETDVSYGLTQLADVAHRSLAPATNDLTAASEAVQRLGVVLRELLVRDSHATTRVDDAGRWILRPRELGPAGYVRLAFERLRVDAAAYPSLAAELLATLGMLRAAARRAERPARARYLDEQARLLLGACARADLPSEDLAELNARAVELGLIEPDAATSDSGGTCDLAPFRSAPRRGPSRHARAHANGRAPASRRHGSGAVPPGT